jgi:hypothetical protein
MQQATGSAVNAIGQPGNYEVTVVYEYGGPLDDLPNVYTEATDHARVDFVVTP